jgi:two-component system sensor histidine kinase RegB
MFESVRFFFTPPIGPGSAPNTTKLGWIVRVRWLALSAQLLSIPIAVHFHTLEPAAIPSFVGVIAALTSVNAVTWLWLQRNTGTTSQSQILLQLFADIAALSMLLSLSGGAWNPLVPILFVHSVLGAMLLEGQLSLIFFALLILCLGLIQVNSLLSHQPIAKWLPASILFPAQFLVALVFWILTAWLSNTLALLQHHVAQAREQKTRIDRLRAVGALAAGLSHEFATPLNTSQMRLARLARTHGLDHDPDLVTAREELDHCGDILRHMAGSQLDPERLSFEAVDVGRLVEQVCTSLSKVHESNPIHFSARGRGSRALLPSIAFSQALMNLIENASESAGLDSPIDVEVSTAGNRVNLTVSDRGVGWPAMVRDHLGEPFVTTKIEGVGLGLYYVHSISQAIGAQLILEDREGGGAVARISLPVAGGQEAEE